MITLAIVTRRLKGGIAAGMVILLLVLAGCSGTEPPSPSNGQYPPWVAKQIRRFQGASVGNPPQSIWLYHYKGQTVYYIPAQCCDQFSTLYDSAGNALCAPDGGITGAGDGRCEDFSKERTGELLVWRDSRPR